MRAGQVFSDWSNFVRAIGRDRRNGLDANALSEKYSGASIRWTGTIRKNQIQDQYAPGIQMDMPRVEVSLGGGRKLVADYVFLNVSSTGKTSWTTVSAHMEVQFKARIRTAASLFLPVNVETFPGDSEEVLTLALEQALPIETVTD
ncbi:hypothetical protein [Steroidobacter sp.]|uniref:hypothetical protein n=1 Tax=Steroidobacter sp. TaxID=1978227 RepID=UPI001A38E604|nr:hypothetical protein [Steroidobacter sp.]MBL8270117.1 hypothetical protein [Steroidobacter sp.]